LTTEDQNRLKHDTYSVKTSLLILLIIIIRYWSKFVICFSHKLPL